MERLSNLIERLKNVEVEILEAVKTTLEESKEIILDMNSEDQLFERGVNRNNVPIASYEPYSSTTIEIKRQKGQSTARVTLRDEGDFHFSFYIEFRTDEFEIKASDWKTEHLVAKYGPEILGLTDDNFKDILENYVAPAVLEVLKRLR